MVQNKRKVRESNKLDSGWEKTWQAAAADQGKRLVLFLQERLTPTQPARQIKRLLEQNHCQVNGHIERFASRPIVLGDTISFRLDRELTSSDKENAKTLQQKRPAWEIIHQDNDLIVAQKPAGIAVDTEEGQAALLEEFGEVFLVHRLDKDTSGLLLLAKRIEIAKALEALFRSHEMEKGYLALVDGRINEESGEVRNHLGKVHSYEGQSLRGAVAPAQGRLAHTLWRVLGRGQGATLVACQPQTGRTHQIRVHMKGLGHPILGDYQYARSFHCPLRPARCLLHAAELTFTHPTTGVTKRYRAHLPADFLQALGQLKIPFARKAQLQSRKEQTNQAEQAQAEQAEHHAQAQAEAEAQTKNKKRVQLLQVRRPKTLTFDTNRLLD